MLSKILAPVDGSTNAFRAFEHALSLSKSTGAHLTALHVVESPPTLYVESQKLLNELLANYRKESAKILDNCKAMADKSGVQIETVIAEGDASSSITGYAQKGGFDLIIVGSRGLGRFKEIVLGSTSSKVLHYAKCPVMIVK